MNCCFCSSVAHCRMVGPTRVSPKKSARNGASARANSSLSTTDSMRESPLPPYSLGHEAQIHPPAKSLAVHSSLKAAFSSLDIENPGVPHPSGRLSTSHLADLSAERLGVGGITQVHGPRVPAVPVGGVGNGTRTIRGAGGPGPCGPGRAGGGVGSAPAVRKDRPPGRGTAADLGLLDTGPARPPVSQPDRPGQRSGPGPVYAGEAMSTQTTEAGHGLEILHLSSIIKRPLVGRLLG